MTDSFHQHRIKESPTNHTVPAAYVMSVKKPQALLPIIFQPSTHILAAFMRRLDPVDRQLPVTHVMTINRITTASIASHKRQLCVHPSQTIPVTSSPSVIHQVKQMVRYLSGIVHSVVRKVLIERASVLEARNMLAVLKKCILGELEDAIVNC